MTAGKEHVAVFNPLVLPLPSWHPDGPDGAIDGFVIPFVMPAPSAGLQPNRHARIYVRNDESGWRAEVSNVHAAASMVKTAEQARALAGAWIRAAELLESTAKRAADVEPQDDDVVDAEVVDDDEDQGDEPVVARKCCESTFSSPHVAGCMFEPREDNPIDYSGPFEQRKCGQ